MTNTNILSFNMEAAIQTNAPAFTNHAFNCCNGIAPDTRSTSLPPLNKINVGMLRMPQLWAMDGTASVLSLAQRR